MKYNSRSIYGCTQAPEGFKVPDNCLLTYNPVTNRMYVHILDWPMGTIYLNGFRGKVAYAQLLNDASEVKMIDAPERYDVEGILSSSKDTLVLQLPITKPYVEVPVIELFMK